MLTHGLPSFPWNMEPRFGPDGRLTAFDATQHLVPEPTAIDRLAAIADPEARARVERYDQARRLVGLPQTYDSETTQQ